MTREFRVKQRNDETNAREESDKGCEDLRAVAARCCAPDKRRPTGTTTDDLSSGGDSVRHRAALSTRLHLQAQLRLMSRERLSPPPSAIISRERGNGRGEWRSAPISSTFRGDAVEFGFVAIDVLLHRLSLLNY